CDVNCAEVLQRKRIRAMDTALPGSKQPYHYGATLSLPEAEKHIATCVSSSERIARADIREVAKELEALNYRIAGAAILTGAGRKLPPLEKILVAHPLLHTAEGQLFRDAAAQACKQLKIRITEIPVRELLVRANATFSRKLPTLQRSLDGSAKFFGPP